MKRYQIAVLALTIILIAGCRRNSPQELIKSDTLSGHYIGVFNRLNADSDTTAKVELDFTANKWTGVSNIPKFPALSEGSYNFVFDAMLINFDNEMPWTADFDWSLILDGVYQYRLTPDSLIIAKTYSTGVVDLYRLQKNKPNP